jgi:hypothetical protein
VKSGDLLRGLLRHPGFAGVPRNDALKRLKKGGLEGRQGRTDEAILAIRSGRFERVTLTNDKVSV